MSRVLHLTSPLTHGDDVRTLQRAITTRLAARHDLLVVKADGEYGPATAHAEAHAAWLLGAANPHDHKRAQAIVEHPALRTPLELARASKLAGEIAKRETSGPAGAVHLALQLARHTPHYTENPAGSNTDRGGIIDIAQKECGLRASYYCGAGAHYVLKHGGGINVSTGIVYCPTTEALAKQGTGGFKEWIPAARPQDAPIGCLVLFTEGSVAGHVEILCAKITGASAHTVGWNTSAGDGGSQSNGGGIFERERPLKGAFPVRGFAVPRWT